jgi:hypothetical protein
MFELFIDAIKDISGILAIMAALGIWSFLL